MLGTGRPLEAFEQDRMASVHEAQRKAEQTSESGSDLTLRESLIATTCRDSPPTSHPAAPRAGAFGLVAVVLCAFTKVVVSGVEGEGRWKEEAEAKSGAR